MKLDIGCGKSKLEGFFGVDIQSFPGVDYVMDVRRIPWPFETDSIEEVHCSHFIEHLSGEERVPFFNELYRVLKPGATARIIAPIWSHERAYGDPTHKFPPISQWTFFYLNRAWRETNGPHTGYTCDFDFQNVGTFDPNDTWVSLRNPETKSTLMIRNINTTQDIICVLTKRSST